MTFRQCCRTNTGHWATSGRNSAWAYLFLLLNMMAWAGMSIFIYLLWSFVLNMMAYLCLFFCDFLALLLLLLLFISLLLAYLCLRYFFIIIIVIIIYLTSAGTSPVMFCHIFWHISVFFYFSFGISLSGRSYLNFLFHT